jgi:hypothetical protein
MLQREEFQASLGRFTAERNTDAANCIDFDDFNDRRAAQTTDNNCVPSWTASTTAPVFVTPV